MRPATARLSCLLVVAVFLAACAAPQTQTATMDINDPRMPKPMPANAWGQGDTVQVIINTNTGLMAHERKTGIIMGLIGVESTRNPVIRDEKLETELSVIYAKENLWHYPQEQMEKSLKSNVSDKKFVFNGKHENFKSSEKLILISFRNTFFGSSPMFFGSTPKLNLSARWVFYKKATDADSEARGQVYYNSEPHPKDKWLADNGQLLKEEVKKGTALLTSKIIAAIFGGN